MPLLVGMAILLGCQLIGESTARFFHLPIPGPVIGMIILLLGLMVLGRVPEGLRITTNGLTKHLAFLFVPAGVGVMANWSAIEAHLISIAVILLLSTAGLQLFMVLFMRRTLGSALKNHDEDPVFKEQQR